MNYELIELNEEQRDDIDGRLEAFDDANIQIKLTGSIHLGIQSDDVLIAGCNAYMTAYRILYVSTFFVDERHRGTGIGRKLLRALEDKARALAANMIRLDTFDWQGAEFYQKMGYEQVGSYSDPEDGFSEYFFLLRL